MEDLDRWPLTGPAGVNDAAEGDNFVWLVLEGDKISTKLSAKGDRFVGLGFDGEKIGTKLPAVGDREEGFGFADNKIGTKVSADCDREEVPPADVEVDSVFGCGKQEGVKLASSSV